jgi:hypothetical protein
MLNGTAGAVTGRGNRSTRRKPTPFPLCLPQISHDMTWARSRAPAVGSQRLTAQAHPKFEVMCKVRNMMMIYGQEILVPGNIQAGGPLPVGYPLALTHSNPSCLKSISFSRLKSSYAFLTGDPQDGI